MLMNDKVCLTGAKYRLKMNVMGNPSGTIAYCVDQYQDFDKKDGIGIQLIMQNGATDGFSVSDQQVVLEYLGYEDKYLEYVFTNVGRLHTDWENKYWDFTP